MKKINSTKKIHMKKNEVAIAKNLKIPINKSTKN
jgi:hypothetical protein